MGCFQGRGLLPAFKASRFHRIQLLTAGAIGSVYRWGVSYRFCLWVGLARESWAQRSGWGQWHVRGGCHKGAAALRRSCPQVRWFFPPTRPVRFWGTPPRPRQRGIAPLHSPFGTTRATPQPTALSGSRLDSSLRWNDGGRTGSLISLARRGARWMPAFRHDGVTRRALFPLRTTPNIGTLPACRTWFDAAAAGGAHRTSFVQERA